MSDKQARSECFVPDCGWCIEHVTPQEAMDAWLDHVHVVHELGGVPAAPSVGSGKLVLPPTRPTRKASNN